MTATIGKETIQLFMSDLRCLLHDRPGGRLVHSTGVFGAAGVPPSLPLHRAPDNHIVPRQNSDDWGFGGRPLLVFSICCACLLNTLLEGH